MKNELGKITKELDGYKVVFTRVLSHPIEKVWNAIVDPEQLRYWFTDIEMDFRPGGKITIRFRDDGKTVGYGEIVSIESPNKFVWIWEGELAIWELSKMSDNKTQLKLTYSKLSADYAINAPAGFHELLDRLENRLDGSEEIYPFGTEANHPDHIKMQVMYETEVFDDYPELVKNKPVIAEKVYDADIERVWKALTEKDQMRQWYFELDKFKPEVGFQFRFSGQGHKGENYIHICTITEILPLKKLQYSWQYEGFSGFSLVTFQLYEIGNKTKLKLTHHGLETFPKDTADFEWSSFNEGWNHLIGISLPDYLNNKINQHKQADLKEEG